MSDAGANGSVTGPSTEGPARVLVVDDEPNITDLVATALRYEGFDVADRARRARGARDASRRSGPT